jgi:hypothetical protein
MTRISRAIPGLFGGMSQQIPAMRHPTQGEFQLNAIASLVSGMYKRPGTQHVIRTLAQWAGDDPRRANIFTHTIDRGPGQRFFVMFSSGSISIVNLETGALEGVKYRDYISGPFTPGNAAPGYLFANDPITAFRAVTVADTTLLLNTEKTVQVGLYDPAQKDTSVGYVYIRQAVGQQTYCIAINGQEYFYGTGVSATVQEVTESLCNAINTWGPTGPPASPPPYEPPPVFFPPGGPSSEGGP